MTRLNVGLAIAEDELAWFDDSPPAGDPACICSYCGFVITEDEIPWRFYRPIDKTEARLCENCFRLLDKQVGGFRDKQERL
jgi:hypothetical protein